MKLGDSLKTSAAQAQDRRIHKKFERAGGESLRSHGKYPNGSQMFWIVIRTFDVSRRFNQGFTLNDALQTRWRGDTWRQMFDTMEDWDNKRYDVLAGEEHNTKLLETIEEHSCCAPAHTSQ